MCKPLGFGSWVKPREWDSPAVCGHLSYFVCVQNAYAPLRSPDSHHSQFVPNQCGQWKGGVCLADLGCLLSIPFWFLITSFSSRSPPLPKDKSNTFIFSYRLETSVYQIWWKFTSCHNYPYNAYAGSCFSLVLLRQLFLLEKAPQEGGIKAGQIQQTRAWAKLFCQNKISWCHGKKKEQLVA